MSISIEASAAAEERVVRLRGELLGAPRRRGGGGSAKASGAEPEATEGVGNADAAPNGDACDEESSLETAEGGGGEGGKGGDEDTTPDDT